jgi:predicted enzyme related to lactoylglutathione lyase
MHQGDNVQVQYLEVMTPQVDETCSSYEQVHGVHFGESEERLGNARTASLDNGGMIGVRAPMHETEEPIVRTCTLVEDIDRAVTDIVEAGGEIAHPPLDIPGLGQFAIYIIGGNQHGLWQV